jgi:hypothetical protein
MFGITKISPVSVP